MPQPVDSPDQPDKPSAESSLSGQSDHQEQTGRYRPELLPFLSCVLVGLAMALLPAVIQWCKIGSMIWIGNGDEVYYLAVGSQAYFNHPAYLSDPVFASGGVSLFRQLPLLPGVWMARALGLGPEGIDICWRIMAGASIAAAWFALIRQCGADLGLPQHSRGSSWRTAGCPGPV